MEKRRIKKSQEIQKKHRNKNDLMDLTFEECFSLLKQRLRQYRIHPIIKTIFVYLLWICVSLSSSLYIMIDKTEVVYDIPLFEAGYLVVSTVMLLVGINNKKPEYILPWILFSIWNVVAQKYFALEYFLFTHYYNIYGIISMIPGIITLMLKLMIWVKVTGFAMDMI